MPLSTQARILRLLQDGRFRRVGGNETLTVDVRVIAGINQNVEAMIGTGASILSWLLLIAIEA